MGLKQRGIVAKVDSHLIGQPINILQKFFDFYIESFIHKNKRTVMENKVLEKKNSASEKDIKKTMKKMRKELDKPEVRAVFLRLKDKWNI